MNIDESRTAKGFTPAASVRQVFGQERVIKSITIHWWGALGQTHDGVNSFFVNGPGTTSAHFVASDGRVTCLVNPADAAWHSGNAEGNATSIGIECRPEATDGDYNTVAELVAYLRSEYGADLPLIPHRDWHNTACPGVWDLDRIDSLARGGINPQGTITQEDTVTEEQMNTLVAEIRASRTVNQQIEDVTRAHVERLIKGLNGNLVINTGQAEDIVAATAARVGALSPAAIADLIPKDIAQAVVDLLAKKLK
ncbi:peptidoglycan recognition protein family protein [Arthrobacter sp. UYCu723]